MVAGNEHERLADAGDAVDEPRLERRAAIREVAGEEQRAAVRRPLEDRQREEVVVQVGRDRDRRPVDERRALRRSRDEAGEADELRVELLIERLRGLLGGLNGLERARDVGPERVVLRLVDLPTRREEHDERDADRQRGPERGADRVTQSRARPVADGERDEQSGAGRGQQDNPDQRAQVRGDRVAGLGAHVLNVEAATLRDARDAVAVDRPQVDVEADGQPDRAFEAHAPVDQRHVQVERTLMPGLGEDRHAADREVLRLRVRVQPDVRATERGGDDRDDDQRPAGDQAEPAAAASVAAA